MSESKVKFEIIQVWRALAVVAVIAFHYYPETLARGYLGVDVFFVVSGFVVTLSLRRLNPLNINSYNVFLQARIRRLIPPLLFVIIVVNLLAILVSSPIHAQRATLVASLSNLFFVSNIHFFRQPVGYFETPIDYSPLLHTWSLSIEWQFYSLLMLFFLTLRYISLKKKKDFSNSRDIFLLLLVIAFTFSLFQYLTNFRLPSLQNATREQLFYLPTGRFWQFLVGVFLAQFYLSRKIRLTSSNNHKTFAQLLLLVSFILLTISNPAQEKFDFLGSFLAVFIISISILIGEVKIPFLSRLLLPIGNASYSIYLWHWPLFVLIGLAIKGSSSTGPISLIATVIASYLSYSYIEKIRLNVDGDLAKKSNLHKIMKRWSVSLLIVVSLFYVVSNNYWSEQVRQLVDSQGIKSKFGRDCWTAPRFVSENFEKCRYPVEGQNGWILLVGDSHAYSVADGIYSIAKESKLGLISYPLCDISDSSKPCVDYLAEAMKIAKMKDVKLIVVTGRFSRQIQLYGSRNVLKNRFKLISEFEKLSLNWLYIKDVPNVGPDPCGGWAWWQPEHICSMAINKMATADVNARAIEDAFTQKIRETNVIDPWKSFCNSAVCIASKDGKVLYLDDNHLNFFGSVYLSEQIRSRIEELIKGKK